MASPFLLYKVDMSAPKPQAVGRLKKLDKIGENPLTRGEIWNTIIGRLRKPGQSERFFEKVFKIGKLFLTWQGACAIINEFRI